MSSCRPLIESLLSLLFPDRCAGCNRWGDLLCAACRSTLVPYPRQNRPSFDGLTDVHVAFVFQSPLREALHQLKYKRQRRLAHPLGALLAADLDRRFLAIDAVLPIPLHQSRLIERGFNQAEDLARAVAQTAHLKLMNEGLIRIRATEQQARLNAQERKQNMASAFAWRGATPPPPRILLVDDVLTTGATMGACAAALLAAGARDVYGLALARSLPGH